MTAPGPAPAPPAPLRCSATSLALDESVRGTASTVTSWLLVEQPGPWGRTAPMRSRMPGPVARTLADRARHLRIRVILLRRPGRPLDGPRACYLARPGEPEPYLGRVTLPHVDAVLDLELEAFAGGERVAPSDPGPLFLVCTNGRRDPCCAERGRPVFRALDRAFGDRVWECSHIGGDRFAATLVCFPHGAYFGRVPPDRAAGIAAGYAEGRLDLPTYRGRSCHPMAAQAAESFARERLGLTGIADLELEGMERTVGGVAVTFRMRDDDARVIVDLDVDRADPPRLLTCHATGAGRPPNYRGLQVRTGGGRATSAPGPRA